MSDAQIGYYIDDSKIDALSQHEFTRRIAVLNRVVNEQMNTAKTTDQEYYESFYLLLEKWYAAANVRYAKTNDKKDLDSREIIKAASKKYLTQKNKVPEKNRQMDSGDVLFFRDEGLSKPPPPPPKGESGVGADGETYTVKPGQNLGNKKAELRNKNMGEVQANYKKDGATIVDKRASLDVALEKAKDLGPVANQAPSLDKAEDYFIKNASYEQMQVELQEIKIAQDLLEEANKDNVINVEKFRNQYQDLDVIKEKIEKSETYSNGAQNIRADRPTEEVPEEVKPEDTAVPEGKVADIPLTGSNLVQEANNYIGEINKIPAFRLDTEMINIRKSLQDAVKPPIQQETLRQSVENARTFFAKIDRNLNLIPDKSERAGQAIDEGLEDMKKIEEQNKLAKEAKTKLTDLRPTAKEGEEERVKKNFNKDVLELKTANDVLKSKVNIQREEIKILKETIEQKLKKENDAMMAGIAPVFRNYLNLNIENVIQESEAQEQVYYSVI